MKTISISKFKATCLKEIDQVGKTGVPLVITKYGKPIAMLVEPEEKAGEKKSVMHYFGCMKGTAWDIGDIVSPCMEMDLEFPE